jgi:hypothetical protein
MHRPQVGPFEFWRELRGWAPPTAQKPERRLWLVCNCALDSIFSGKGGTRGLILVRPEGVVESSE